MTAGEAFLRNFSWVDGHADVWSVFSDASSLAESVQWLCDAWRSEEVTHVVGVEARGFLLGGAVAVGLGAGFVAIRKQNTGLLPGPKLFRRAAEDYRGQRHELRMQHTLPPAARVVLIDDWAERGSQALAAQALVEACGATFLGVGLLVDQLTPEARKALGRITALLSADSLAPSAPS